MNRMTVEKIVKYSKDRRDAFWFATDDKVVTVARVTDTKTGKSAVIKALGNVYTSFYDEVRQYSGSDAVSEAKRRGMTDVDLSDNAEPIDGQNNWFDIEISGQTYSDIIESDHEIYDIEGAIRTAKKLLKEAV